MTWANVTSPSGSMPPSDRRVTNQLVANRSAVTPHASKCSYKPGRCHMSNRFSWKNLPQASKSTHNEKKKKMEKYFCIQLSPQALMLWCCGSTELEHRSIYGSVINWTLKRPSLRPLMNLRSSPLPARQLRPNCSKFYCKHVQCYTANAYNKAHTPLSRRTIDRGHPLFLLQGIQSYALKAVVREHTQTAPRTNPEQARKEKHNRVNAVKMFG